MMLQAFVGTTHRIRFMRLVVFFDLPVETARQRKNYRLFRKFLLKDGYLMMQNSVYAKLVTNAGVSAGAIQRIRNNAPKEGLVQILKVTEKQFSQMEFVTGECKEYEELDNLEELIVL